ncbi:MAG: flagellar biosynthesis protein FlgN [Spirochaetaceae bacterium]|nr:flagellar biosynthesis protein FlgN [Spirochaetaceae bacterium]
MSAKVQERAAAIERLRDVLHKQRDCFSAYLAILKRQKTALEQGNVEAAGVYVALEEQIVADIFSLQKVITPLESWYRRIEPQKDIMQLKAALSDLCDQSISLSKQNRTLLLSRMNTVRSAIQSIQKNPYRLRHYDSGMSALMLDMTT